MNYSPLTTHYSPKGKPMAIQGFDYKDFAQNLAQQAYELLPPDFNDDQKNYVANTLLNFSYVYIKYFCF